MSVDLSRIRKYEISERQSEFESDVNQNEFQSREIQDCE